MNWKDTGAAMARLKKRTELLVIPLEIATGKLSSLEQFNHKITRLRIEQAIARRPELKALLQPILAELDEHGRNVIVAKAAINAVKKLIKDSD